MSKNELCPRTGKCLSDAECSDYICSTTDLRTCRVCARGREMMVTTVLTRDVRPTLKDEVRIPASVSKQKKSGGFEKITVAVPPDLKKRFREMAKSGMGSMSGQGRYLILRALERMEAKGIE